MFEAARNGDLKTIQKFIDEKPSSAYLLQNTPGDILDISLRLAVSNGQVEVVKLLLTDKRINPASGMSDPLRAAVKNDHSKLIEILLADGRSDPTHGFLSAAEEGHLKWVKYFMEVYNIDPSTQDDLALKRSSFFEYFDVVDYLLLDDRVNWEVMDLATKKIILKRERNFLRKELTEIFLTIREFLPKKNYDGKLFSALPNTLLKRIAYTYISEKYKRLNSLIKLFALDDIMFDSIIN